MRLKQEEVRLAFVRGNPTSAGGDRKEAGFAVIGEHKILGPVWSRDERATARQESTVNGQQADVMSNRANIKKRDGVVISVMIRIGGICGKIIALDQVGHQGQNLVFVIAMQQIVSRCKMPCMGPAALGQTEVQQAIGVVGKVFFA